MKSEKKLNLELLEMLFWQVAFERSRSVSRKFEEWLFILYVSIVPWNAYHLQGFNDMITSKKWYLLDFVVFNAKFYTFFTNKLSENICKVFVILL